MIHSSGPENSLPEEFKKQPFHFSFLRTVGMTAVMGLAVLIFKKGVQNDDMIRSPQRQMNVMGHALNSPVEPSPSDSSPAPAQVTGSDELAVARSLPGSASLHEPASFEFLKQSASMRKYSYHEQSNRAFVSADVVNFRLKPGGGLLGQLPKGEVLDVLGEPDQTGFLKVKTSYGQIGYVSKDLISADRAFGIFNSDRLDVLQPNDVLVSVSSGQNLAELSRHYSFFQELLDKLSTKASFDFLNSNLRYLILTSSEVLYPTDPSTLLSFIRQSSFRPAVFLERPRATNQVDEGGMMIKTKLPVRRVSANQMGQSASLQQVYVSTKCYPLRMTVKTEQPISSKLELMIVDIKKSTTVTLTTRPHKGDPSFTWAFADLNGDTWQDLAIYFGGQTSASPYRFLFVAHNIGGLWQLHRVEDRSGMTQG